MSKAYLRFSWITLVFIFLVTLAGSVVRTTGSGMGCPDWPKCFGQIIPPTSADQLPDDYKTTYAHYRQKKVEKFAGFMEKIGFEAVAEELRTDETLLIEADFNAARTWTEYGNRLVGFIAGNCVLILFIWTLIRYRSKRLLLGLTFLNLILIGFEAWFGSIVVATNLVPWTITLHMLFALIIIGIQIKIIRLIKNRSFQLRLPAYFKWLFYLSVVLTFIQILLGAQVRQEVDFMVKDGLDRALWIDQMEGNFLLHRSFSWLLLAVNIALWWVNRQKAYGIVALTGIVGLILLLFVTGILFSYAGMPALIQPVHLMIAAILLGVQFFALDYFRYRSDNSLIR